MTSEAQKKAVKKYKEKVKRMHLEFSPAEEALWEHISKQPRKQTYIKNLIRDDMDKKTQPDYRTILEEVLVMVKRGDPWIRTAGFIEDELKK